MTLASWLGWAGGAFVVVYTDQQREPSPPEEWGLGKWGLTCAVAGGLTLPFYYWNTRGARGLLPGIGLGIGLAVFAYAIRLALSIYFKIAVV